MRPVVHAVFATMVVCLATVAYTQHTPDFGRFLQGHNDFLLRYSQASIVGTGHMYEVEADHREQERVAGFYIEGSYQVRLPWQAWLWAPLTRLRYFNAYCVWIAANLICFAFLVPLWLLPRGYVLWGMTYFPIAASIVLGQDALMLALCLAGAFALAFRGRDTAAGLTLALCTAKPHLFLLVPVALIAHRRYKIFASATAGVLALLAISTIVEGPDWISRLISSMQSMELQSLLKVGPRPTVFQFGVNRFTVFIALLLAVLFSAAIWRMQTLEGGLAVAVMGSILVAPHAAIYDLPVLLIAIVGLPLEGKSEWLRIALLSPLPYWALLNGSPWQALLPVLILVTVLVSAFTTDRPEPSVVAGRIV